MEVNNIVGNEINWPKTLLFSLFSIVAAYISSFFITNLVTGLILKLFTNPSIETLIVVDAITSFIILLSAFYCFTFIKGIHKTIVVLTGALFMFLYWGFESRAFYNGLNPMYPAWFEINMAINDLVAGFVALFISKRITRQ